MSRVEATCKFAGQLVEVIAGWDNPLKTCFLQIELSDEQADEPAFGPLLELQTKVMFRPLDEEEVRGHLEDASLALPEAFYRELAQDVAVCARNKIVRFDVDGVRSQLC